MDIIRLLRDFNVEHVTEGNKHCAEGWVQVHCPFCAGEQNYHLGYNLHDDYWNCYRCGWHPPVKTLMGVLHLDQSAVLSILPEYGVNRTTLKRKKTDKKEFVFPSGVTELWKPHRKYLVKRGFDPDKIEKLWNVKGTGPVSKLDLIDYRFRIIIPFKWNGETVSFDSRDVTEKQKNKYQACPKEREVIEHKKILYGNQEYWESTGIGVEGPTDVWRLGAATCATSGIKFTPAQVKVIAQTFKRFAVMFDDEPQAQIQAKKLVAELKFRGVDSWNVKIKGDPGSLKQHEADELVDKIMKQKIYK
jgi:hypothetical protein